MAFGLPAEISGEGEPIAPSVSRGMIPATGGAKPQRATWSH
jgi:hypothetical protein